MREFNPEALAPHVEPLVSVIIPCYGRSLYLGDAIESALRQSYPRREIIVVDDGSPGEDLAVIARKFPGARYVRQPHAGVSVARNRGVRESRGEFLIFLDSDDQLLDNAIEAGVRAFAAHPDCAFVYGRCEWMDGCGSAIAGPELEQVADDHYRALLRSNFIIIDTVMHRRAVFTEVGGFRSDFIGAEDYDLYLRLARRHAVHDHRELVARYRRHPQNMSNNAGAMLASVVRLLQTEQQTLTEPALLAACREGLNGLRDYWGDKVVACMRADARARQWRAAGRSAASLLRRHPKLFAAQLTGATRTRLARLRPFR